MQRRDFLRTGAIVTTGAAVPGWAFAQSAGAPERKFKISLSPGAIGVSGQAAELLEPAAALGFEAITLERGIGDLGRARLMNLKQRADELGMSWGCGGLPVEFRQSAERFQQDLAALPAHAATLEQLGATRIGTWIMPCHDSLDYRANFDLHRERLRQVATLLADNGVRLGLEYVGPTTLRDSKRYDFVSNGAQLRDLIAAIDRPNVGVILDSFHWYTAEEDTDELRNWTNADIVAVDLNDACAHFGPREQIDGIRELPGATGVIDLTAFIGVLRELAYDGTVRAEPFSDTLSAMDDELAMRATVSSLRRAVAG